jgi:low temperature requirement protein LtrA
MAQIRYNPTHHGDLSAGGVMSHTHRPFAVPRLHIGGDEEHRKVSWLELFFDLVYVAAVIELGYILSGDISGAGIVNFIVLYIPIWWSWTGTTLYANRFASDDVMHRVLVFVQIFFIAAMAVNVYGGLEENFANFAVSYALVRVVLIVMYFRVWQHVPEAKSLALLYMVGFSIAAVLWVVAATQPAPTRFGIGALALLIDFFTGINPWARRMQRALPPSPNHLPERYALFTIIVFGEQFLKVIRDLSGEPEPIQAWMIGALMTAVSAALWWLYFDNIAESKVKWAKARFAYTWLYAHLPLHIAITAFGVGVPKIIAGWQGAFKAEYQLLLCGAMALALLVIGLLERTVQTHHEPGRDRVEMTLRFGGAALVLVLGLLSGINAFLLAFLLMLIGIAQVVVNIYYNHRAGQTEAHTHPLELNPETDKPTAEESAL